MHRIKELDVGAENLKLEYGNLFKLDSTLSKRYNAFLQGVFSIHNSTEGFSIDLRGKSSELKEPLGDFYLTQGRINPYVVVVSPDQLSAPLTDCSFSYREQVLRNSLNPVSYTHLRAHET